MIYRLYFLVVSSLMITNLFAQKEDLVPFKLYNHDGKEVKYGEILELASESDVLLFGEYHDNSIIHWIQYRVARDLSKRVDLVMGAEFFERDDQVLIDEYLDGLMDDKKFEAVANLWPNYKTDYKPLLELAKDSGISFIATNVPRRYASFVAKYGLDTLNVLSPIQKGYIARLPIPFYDSIPGYPEMMEMMSGHGMNPTNFVKAQAIKDATMAESILNNWTTGKVFLHINGDYHSANYGGIFWYLKEYKSDIEVITLKVYSSRTLEWEPEWVDSGDLIIVVADDITKTH